MSVQPEITSLLRCFFFNVKGKNVFQKLAGLWLVAEVVNHVGLYGSKVAEGCSAFQHRSCYLFQYSLFLSSSLKKHSNTYMWNTNIEKSSAFIQVLMALFLQILWIWWQLYYMGSTCVNICSNLIAWSYSEINYTLDFVFELKKFSGKIGSLLLHSWYTQAI